MPRLRPGGSGSWGAGRIGASASVGHPLWLWGVERPRTVKRVSFDPLFGKPVGWSKLEPLHFQEQIERVHAGEAFAQFFSQFAEVFLVVSAE